VDPGGDVESTKPSRSTRGGRLLAEKLAVFANRPDVIVLALPRCGVPVGYEVARSLGAPLDVFLVRKLGAPGYEELAMGAIANGGLRVLDDNVVKTLRIPNHVIETVVAKEEKELARRERLYRGGGPFPDLGDGPCSWWMMGWRPAPPCRLWSRRCGQCLTQLTLHWWKRCARLRTG
jgi:hypothetical protein